MTLNGFKIHRDPYCLFSRHEAQLTIEIKYNFQVLKTKIANRLEKYKKY